MYSFYLENKQDSTFKNINTSKSIDKSRSVEK